MTSLECWIWLASLKKLRPVNRLRLIEAYGGAQEIYQADQKELSRHSWLSPEERQALELRDTGEAAQVAERCHGLGIQILCCCDAAFPSRLRNIPDPPAVLYLKGRLPDLERLPCIAVVGTRDASPYGEKMARKLGRELAEKGAAVVTGLAAGIDSCAAEGALAAGGKVIGVLGVAINSVYPSSNSGLYADVQGSGALVSEYPPDARGSKMWFRIRNRIMAGMSLGVAVVEAPERSGALITARLANEYGRDVFAVPGNCDSPGSRGTNRILREYATLVESGEDILEEYRGQYPALPLKAPPPAAAPQETRNRSAPLWEDWRRREAPKAAPPPSPAPAPPPAADKPPAPPVTLREQFIPLTVSQLKIIGAMHTPYMHIDEIIEESGLTASCVLSELTILQVKGYVKQEPGKRFSLNLGKYAAYQV